MSYTQDINSPLNSHHEVSKRMFKIYIVRYSREIFRGVKVFNSHVKILVQTESDCVLSFGFMFLLNSVSVVMYMYISGGCQV